MRKCRSETAGNDNIKSVSISARTTLPVGYFSRKVPLGNTGTDHRDDVTENAVGDFDCPLQMKELSPVLAAHQATQDPPGGFQRTGSTLLPEGSKPGQRQLPLFNARSSAASKKRMTGDRLSERFAHHERPKAAQLLTRLKTIPGIGETPRPATGHHAETGGTAEPAQITDSGRRRDEHGIEALRMHRMAQHRQPETWHQSPPINDAQWW
jgi:hypothetical protein